jgi:hypothetical protein
VLVKLVLYCLSHTSSPFCSDYLEMGSLIYLSGVALHLDLPDLTLPRS